MYLLLVILMLIASVLMCFIVLIQNSKGGGLASGFSSSNQIMGVRKTTDFLEKATWTLAAVMVVFSIVSAYTIPSSTAVRSDASTFYKKRIPRVFYPFLIWSVLYNLFPWITGLLAWKIGF